MKKEQQTTQLSDISPYCLARTVLRNIWMVVLSALTCVMGALLYTQQVYQPTYRASMTYAVISKQESYFSSAALSAAREVCSVLTELIQSDVVLDDVRADSPESADFNGKITATQVAESNFIVITADADSPKEAFFALRALVNQFPSFSSYISKNSIVHQIQGPSVASAPINPINRTKIVRLAGAAGALLMAALLCVISVMRGTIQTRSGARHLLDATVLATIRHERKQRTLKSWFKHNTSALQVFSPTISFAYSEQITAICAQLEHEKEARQRSIFLVTGVGENEGKSTVAANIASALALKGQKVVLLDADFRKPAMNLIFNHAYRARLPLNQLLRKPINQENTLQCIQRHARTGVYMMFPRTADADAANMIGSESMRQLLAQLRGFDYVIIDSPPMGFFPDAEALADLSDASLMVVRQDVTPACALNDAIDALRASSSAFLGCVLNDMRLPVTDSRSYGYGYGYGHRYGRNYHYGDHEPASTAHKQ